VHRTRMMVMIMMWVGISVAVGCLLCAVLMLRLRERPVRCPDCRVSTSPVTSNTSGAWGPVVEVAHWCPRCTRVVARRFIALLCE
jgi:hypothetical protein